MKKISFNLPSCKNDLEQFFVQEQESLKQSYPGIKLSRLKDELNYYLQRPNSSFTTFLESLLKGVPLEYITERSFFYKSEFRVNPDVLIPRSETEILVEEVSLEVKRRFKEKSVKLDLIDVGCGPGTIILSLMQECGEAINAYASDISEAAIDVCKQNLFNLAFRMPKESDLIFFLSDRFKNIDPYQKFDMIITNPPYIKKQKDRVNVHDQVDSFEPHISLYLEDEIYDKWFFDFFRGAWNALKSEGYFFMEGHEDHLQSFLSPLKEIGFKNIKVIKDYTGRDRFLSALKDPS